MALDIRVIKYIHNLSYMIVCQQKELGRSKEKKYNLFGANDLNYYYLTKYVMEMM